MRTRKKIKRNLEVWLAKSLMGFARILPREAGLKVFSGIGSLAGRLMRTDRRRAIDNLGIAFPEATPLFRRAMADAMFKALGANAYEFLNLGGSSAERLGSLVERVDGQEYFDEAYGRGEGLIVITGHIGCWELLAAYFATRGYLVNVVGRELWEKRLNRELIKIRESVGYRTIDRDTGGKELLRVLRKKKGIVAVLIDQHTRVSGIYVPFFNKPAHTPTGVARLALSTGTPILPMAIYMTPSRRHAIHTLPPIEMPEAALSRDEQTRVLTERCSNSIEELIRLDPKQWVWFHRRWREPEGMETSYAAVG